MCPVCMTTGALAVASVTSASGLAALVANRLRARAAAPPSCAPVMDPALAAPETSSPLAGSPSDRDRPIVTGGQP